MKIQFTILFLFLLQFACEQPDCSARQKNAILNENSPESPVYQAEIQRLVLARPSAVRFYFDRRETAGGKDYLVLNCFGKNFCGQLYLLVEQDDKLSSRLQNQSGYRGANLAGLELEQNSQDETMQLVYRSVHKIID